MFTKILKYNVWENVECDWYSLITIMDKGICETHSLTKLTETEEQRFEED